MHTHIIFRLQDDVICCPFDTIFFGWLNEIHEKFPNNLKMVKGYEFTSKKAFCEWMDDLVPYVCDIFNENEVIVYQQDVDVEEWYDAYFGEQGWKDFDLIMEKGDDRYKTMWDKEAPLHPFFQYSKEDDDISLLHSLYAKNTMYGTHPIPIEWMEEEEDSSFESP
jgi:hypothetical protein